MFNMIQVKFGDVDFPAVSFCNLNPLRRSKLSLETGTNLTQLINTFDQSIADQFNAADSDSDDNRRKRSSTNRVALKETSDTGYDVIDEMYVPVLHLGGLPWYENTKGDNSLELQNSLQLTSVSS